MTYSIDTSALIQARVELYPPDVFPTLWGRIEKLIDDGGVKAVDEVLRELERKDDALHDWAKKRSHLFVRLDAAIQAKSRVIINQFPSLTNTRSAMGGAADAFVIALAQECKLTVVTAEKEKPSKPRIPDVCKTLNIRCIALIEMFRNEGWQI